MGSYHSEQVVLAQVVLTLVVVLEMVLVMVLGTAQQTKGSEGQRW
jgi:hypothetical protein